jgi:hypothetical protein
MAIVINVAFYNDEGEVTKQIVVHEERQYGWAVENAFELLGKKIAKFVDEQMDE